MTEKIYYADPYLTKWEGNILSISRGKKLWEVILDRTCFYPEGGGQPGDRGTINDLPVVDTRKSDRRIIHLMKAPPGEGKAQCSLDWEHRFDYMQQHTGQHILSGALKKVGAFDTVSVHQGEEYTSIEIETDEISREMLNEIEMYANGVITANVPVTAEWTTLEEIGKNPDLFPLRRKAKVSGDIRIIKVGGFDCVACGGIHTKTSGEVGLVKAVNLEKIRGRIRVLWKIGRRAYRDYGEKTAIVNALIEEYSSPQDQLPSALDIRRNQYLELNSQVNLYKTRYAELLARSLFTEKQTVIQNDGTEINTIVADIPVDQPGILREIALRLQDREGLKVCLTAEIAGKIHWCITTSIPDCVDFQEIKKSALPLIKGKGGGRPPFWQGAGENCSGHREFRSRITAIFAE